MSLESALRDVLQAICSRAYPDVAPAGASTPYVVWQQIGGRATSYTDDAVPDEENSFVQVQAWANTRVEANGLMRQIEAAMVVAAAFAARPMSAMSAAPSDDENLRGAMQDFDIWIDR
ncbi:tail completion protein gp17 [Azohydromonas lata]|uniref:tail completion protein gp17 n=1 Tax=Azohydromonas lata TaxID=45677 RepID=UPI0008321F27|nr:DUF3168 domain-containing protein [Azohydromonas lata]